MEALRIISDEHQALAAILHALRFMLKEIRAGRLTPDLALFQAMVHYLDAYAEQRHHPKEERLFRCLAGRTDEGQVALHALALQHADAPGRIAALRDALAGYVSDPAAVEPFVAAFEAYAEFYRRHMLLEEEVVLPLLRSHLTPADWQEVDAAFAAEQTATEAAREDFSALFSQLVAYAPPPLGLGAGSFPGTTSGPT